MSVFENFALEHFWETFFECGNAICISQARKKNIEGAFLGSIIRYNNVTEKQKPSKQIAEVIFFVVWLK